MSACACCEWCCGVGQERARLHLFQQDWGVAWPDIANAFTTGHLAKY